MAETARRAAQAFPVDLDRGAHSAQRLGESEPVFVDGFVNDRQSRGLCEGNDKGLLPIGHEAGMHVGLKHDGPQFGARMVEPDPGVGDVEGAADFAEHIEERHHRALLRAADENIASCGERGGAPRVRLAASGERGVGMDFEPLDTLNSEDPIGIDRDDGAHFLQDRNEVVDFWFDRGVAQFGNALGADGGKQELFGCSDRRIGKFELGAPQAVGGRDADPGLVLFYRCPECAQYVEVVVDGPVANVAATEIWNEGLADPVDEWPAKQDRYAARAGVRVDVCEVCLLDSRWIKRYRAGLFFVGDRYAVEFEQLADDLDVANLRNVAQNTRALTEESGDHRFGYEILSPPD